MPFVRPLSLWDQRKGSSNLALKVFLILNGLELGRGGSCRNCCLETKIEPRTREVAQSTHKHEGLRLVPNTYVKIRGMVHACHPSSGEVETEVLGLANS